MATTDHAVFVDPLTRNWLAADQGSTLIDPDGVHPNATGHQRLAFLLTQSLHAAGLGPVK